MRSPQNLWAYDGERDVLALAVALLAGVAQKHPFAQGNKRTALIGARNFLQSNGYDLDIEDEVLGRHQPRAFSSSVHHRSCDTLPLSRRMLSRALASRSTVAVVGIRLNHRRIEDLDGAMMQRKPSSYSS